MSQESKFYELECVKIDAAIEDIRHRKESLLRSRGWSHTASTVGCYWMWFRVVDGVSYGCCIDDAYRIQNTLDRRDYADAHPEEFED